jgi:hypothetical protein
MPVYEEPPATPAGHFFVFVVSDNILKKENGGPSPPFIDKNLLP